MRRTTIAITAMAVFTFGISVGCEKEPPRDPEAERIEGVLSEFFREAYDPTGDIDIAYGLLTQESRDSCSRESFEKMVIVGRQTMLYREPTLKIESVKIRDDEATIEIAVVVGTFTNSLFPPEVTLLRESAGWRYAITTDPTCSSSIAFYDLQERPGVVPGREVTPVSEGNPACDPSYPFDCIPSPPPLLECADLEISGFAVWPPDPHGFDSDHDGFGCEE